MPSFLCRTDMVPQLRGDFVELHVAEPTALLHALTGWAVGRGEVLSGLAVDRPSLEDVYLSLTGDSEDRGDSKTGDEAQ